MTNKKTAASKIILAAGGTGGHLFPAMTLAKILAENGLEPVFMIDGRACQKFEEKNTENWSFYVIKSGGIVGKNFFTRLKGAFCLFSGTLQAGFILYRLKPKAVIGFGGYPSLPPLLATKLPFMGKILRIIHEGNAVAGTANRLLARLGTKICLSFPKTQGFPDQRDTQFVGMPIRPEFENIPQNAPYQVPKQDEKLRLLVLGGSLGASALSNLIPEALGLLPEAMRQKIKISQQAGEEYIPKLQEFYDMMGIEVQKLAPFFHDVIDQITSAHLIIGRSGGGTVAEIMAAERPAIFIPLPTAAADEQTKNAEYLSHSGAGWIIPQKKLEEHPDLLTNLLQKMLENTQMLAIASQELQKLSQPLATQRFAHFILSLLSIDSHQNNI